MPPLPRPAIFDILIIGSGPAGLNAALACGRMRTKALIFDSSRYRNQGVTHMHTVASRDHMDPREFGRIAREQIETRYDTVWFEERYVARAAKKVFSIVGTEKEEYEGFEVHDAEGTAYAGKKLILATGSKDVFPDIDGYKENWPSHIYQCLACDGYEQRGSAMGILNFDAAFYAHMVQMGSAFGPERITLFSNGPVSQDEGVQKALRLCKAFGATLDERRITRLVNNGPTHEEGVTLHFEEGDPATVGFLVHRPKVVNRGQHLIEQLGVEMVDEAQGGHVRIADTMFNETSVRGVFAAGDTMVMMKQVAIAMAEGLKAAAGAGAQISMEIAEGIERGFEGKQGGEEVEGVKAQISS